MYRIFIFFVIINFSCKEEEIFISYYSNGNVKERGILKNGLKEGNWKSWDEDENLESSRNFKSGKLDGISVYYYSNGNIYTPVSARCATKLKKAPR